MKKETAEQPRPLRSGYTTGACATATALAAAQLLLTQQTVSCIQITLPKGRIVNFDLTHCQLTSDNNAVDSNTIAEAGTIKDAGDDPDVTHGALITTQVSLQSNPGIIFCAGSGVGKVTRQGLPIAIGEPAINPIPRQMMQTHLQNLAIAAQYHGGFVVTVSVKNGEILAKKTMNARLGIIGGLSILGTTGIVRPFSCSAYIASIQQGIDVAYANNIQHIAACTGSTSEQTIQQYYPLPEMALIEMGDFVGAVLKHLKHAPIPRVTLIGGFGKISKLAAGHLNLHSQKSTIDMVKLAQIAKTLGASSHLQTQILKANTSIEALTLCEQNGLPLGDYICQLAQTHAMRLVPSHLQLEVWAVDRMGVVVGKNRLI